MASIPAEPILQPFSDVHRRESWWGLIPVPAAHARPHRVICLLIGIWIFNAYDLTLTLWAHGHGVLFEENPIARQMLEWGVASLILYKIGLILIGSYPLLKLRHALATEVSALIIFLAYLVLAVQWSEYCRLAEIAVLPSQATTAWLDLMS